MSAIMVFEGFQPINPMTEIHGEMLLDVLGLTKLDIESFPMPDYSQIIDHLKPISDLEVKQWIITNTYSPVLKSRRTDALEAYRAFCSDLKWDTDLIKETMRLTEDIAGMKPIDNGVWSTGSRIGTRSTTSTGSGCLSIIILFIVSTALFVFTSM